MNFPTLDYASHEFGIFEYGFETNPFPNTAAFESFGVGDATAVGASIRHLLYESEASTSFLPILQSVKGAKYVVSINVDDSIETQHVLVSQLRSRGTSTVAFSRGFIEFSEFDSEGASLMDMILYDGIQFTIRGLSEFTTVSAKSAAVGINIEGVSRVGIIAQEVQNMSYKEGYYTHFLPSSNYLSNSVLYSRSRGTVYIKACYQSNTKYAIEVVPEISIRSGTFFNAFTRSHGTSSFLGTGFHVRKKDSVLASKGRSTSKLLHHPLIIKGIDLTAEGKAIFSSVGFTKYFLDFEGFGEGNSSTDLVGGQVYLGTISIDGQAYSFWNRGNHVLTEMDFAYELVIRPYEDRGTIWKLL